MFQSEGLQTLDFVQSSPTRYFQKVCFRSRGGLFLIVLSVGCVCVSSEAYTQGWTGVNCHLHFTERKPHHLTVATLGSALAGTRAACPRLYLGPWLAFTSWTLAHRPFPFKMSFLSLSSSCMLLWRSGKSFQLFPHSGFQGSNSESGLAVGMLIH